MSAFHLGLCLLFSRVAAHTFLAASVWCDWDLQGGEVLQKKAVTPTFSSRCVISLGNLHSFSCSVLLCPCRVHQLAGETSIQLPSLEQRCMYLVAELIVLGHFIPTMRSTATALKYLIRKQTPGWTLLQLQCSLKAGEVIQHVSVGLLREDSEGNSCLPQKRGVWSAGWRCGLARGAQSLASTKSCCPVKSLRRSPAHEGDVSKGGQPAPLCFVFVGTGTHWALP